MTMLRLRRSVFALFAIVAGLSAPLGSSTHAGAFTPRVPAGSLGINGEFLLQGGDGAPTAVQQNAQLDEVESLGIRVIRNDTAWDVIEPNAPNPITGQHTYNWGTLDQAEGEMAAHNIRWAAIVDYSAKWATAAHNWTEPPTDDTAWSQFAGALAKRYGASGDFWKANPTLPYLPVLTWEIWNEENWGFWQDYPLCNTHVIGVDQGPARYADMFMDARAAITAVDPNAKVMIGGLVGITSTSGSQCTVQEYLAGMKAHRPHLAVDVIAVHIYLPSSAQVLNQLAAVRHAIDALGWAKGLPLDLNETGWPVGGNGWGLTDAQRGDLLATDADQAMRSNCNVIGYVPYTWLTGEKDPSNSEDWYGIGSPTTPSSPHGSAIAYGNMVQTLQGTGTTAPDPSTVNLC